MTNKIHIDHSTIASAALDVVNRIRCAGSRETNYSIYGIPRGGIAPAYLVNAYLNTYLGVSSRVVSDPSSATHFIDDLIYSGATEKRFKENYPDIPFYALFNKSNLFKMDDRPWLVFPWEETESGEASAEDIVTRLLQFIGEDPNRGGLLETPKRVLKAFEFWTQGYKQDPKEILKTFEDGAEDCDEMVVVKNIPIYSQCEHHLAPFFGHVTIAYIPNGKVVGLSKLSRLADVFARRLQVQERLTNQIANSLSNELGAKGVGVVVECRHMCMESRGICKQGSTTITSALRGVIKDDPSARAEFVALTKK